MDKCKCKKCKHEWIPRVENPKECPECKSREWNEEDKIIVTKEDEEKVKERLKDLGYLD